ncbi:hypothetical protein L873DRAFT_1847145 [Choiromyces venosus 120613-1]|uniref:Uncharacterized protein n=1 Tax=Choiromyces venosus 120613-1 TaxID=1336337 RepID=A0A3N4J8A1_9PEZI|nr:hypothetical protein L873DRAFT_1847145 [Choiromyces venosus 120613-1]
MLQFIRATMFRSPRIYSRIQRHRAFASMPDKVPKLGRREKQTSEGLPNISESYASRLEDSFIRANQDIRDMKAILSDIQGILGTVQIGVILMAILGGGSTLLGFLVWEGLLKGPEPATIPSPLHPGQLEGLVREVCVKAFK